MATKRRPLWMLGSIGAVLLVGAFIVIKELKETDALLLHASARVDPQPLAWLWEQGLYRFHPTPEEVKELNKVAGAGFAVMNVTDERSARRLLKHFIDAGVDINAVDQRVNAVDQRTQSKLTALHGAVLEPDVMAVKLLLEFGASRDMRDAKGRTALDLARELQAKDPKPQREQVIQLLESRTG